jgi:hypothetical protein
MCCSTAPSCRPAADGVQRVHSYIELLHNPVEYCSLGRAQHDACNVMSFGGGTLSVQYSIPECVLAPRDLGPRPHPAGPRPRSRHAPAARGVCAQHVCDRLVAAHHVLKQSLYLRDVRVSALARVWAAWLRVAARCSRAAPRPGPAAPQPLLEGGGSHTTAREPPWAQVVHRSRHSPHSRPLEGGGQPALDGCGKVAGTALEQRAAVVVCDVVCLVWG